MLTAPCGLSSGSELATHEVRKQLSKEVLPRHLGFFVKLLEDSTTGWIAGTAGPSIADFVVVSMIQSIAKYAKTEGFGLDEDLVSSRPALHRLVEKLMNEPKIVEYYRK